LILVTINILIVYLNNLFNDNQIHTKVSVINNYFKLIILIFLKTNDKEIVLPFSLKILIEIMSVQSLFY